MSTQTTLFGAVSVETAPEKSRPLQVSDPKLNALVALTKEIVSERGHVRTEVMKNFLSAGYRKDQVLEVLIGVALKR